MVGAQDLAGLWRAQREVLADVATVLRGPERAAVRLALTIAFLDQAMASTAIVNYAPQVRPPQGPPLGAPSRGRSGAPRRSPASC